MGVSRFEKSDSAVLFQLIFYERSGGTEFRHCRRLYGLIRLKIIDLYKYMFYNTYYFMVRLYNGCVLAVIEWKMMDGVN
jgi:hypothetical protein